MRFIKFLICRYIIYRIVKANDGEALWLTGDGFKRMMQVLINLVGRDMAWDLFSYYNKITAGGLMKLMTFHQTCYCGSRRYSARKAGVFGLMFNRTKIIK